MLGEDLQDREKDLLGHRPAGIGFNFQRTRNCFYLNYLWHLCRAGCSSVLVQFLQVIEKEEIFLWLVPEISKDVISQVISCLCLMLENHV